MSDYLLADDIGSYWGGYDWGGAPGSFVDVYVVRTGRLDHLDTSARPVLAVIRKDPDWTGLRDKGLDVTLAMAIVDCEKRAWILGPEHDGRPHAEHVFHMPG